MGNEKKPKMLVYSGKKLVYLKSRLSQTFTSQIIGTTSCCNSHVFLLLALTFVVSVGSGAPLARTAVQLNNMSTPNQDQPTLDTVTKINSFRGKDATQLATADERGLPEMGTKVDSAFTSMMSYHSSER